MYLEVIKTHVKFLYQNWAKNLTFDLYVKTGEIQVHRVGHTRGVDRTATEAWLYNDRQAKSG